MTATATGCPTWADLADRLPHLGGAYEDIHDREYRLRRGWACDDCDLREATTVRGARLLCADCARTPQAVSLLPTPRGASAHTARPTTKEA